MSHVDLDKVYSNDYADFIIEYNGDPLALEQYEPNAVNIVNFFYATVYLPASQLTNDVVSKMGYAVLPSLFGFTSQASLEASGVFRIRNLPSFGLRGKGVLIGIVDSGIDYTNPIFQYEDRTTKIVSIWDQTIRGDHLPEGMAYGTEYTREQINEALQSEDPFSIVPSKDEIGHGTMIAGIAAGNDVPESNFYGVAPDAELVIVKLKPAKQNIKNYFRIPEDEVCYQENDIVFGIQYLFRYAARVNKPIVICIPVDTSQYAHDGRGTTSNWLSLIANIPGTSVILSVGNEGNARRHYHGVIKEDTPFNTVELNIGPNDRKFSMELWGSTPNLFSVEIITPSGEYVPRIGIRTNETKEITFIFEPTTIYVDYQLIENQSGDQLILLRFSKASPGVWKFQVYSRGIYPSDFDMWLPMNNFISTETFFLRSDPNITLLSASCARVPITVTAYNVEDESLYLNAGRGYTRVNLIKPDIAAPGVKIIAPTLNQGFQEVTGTSVAAAHTAGIAAMLFEWGIVKGNYKSMSSLDMKVFLIRGARRKTDMEYPNREWGYGILDLFNVFNSLRQEEQ
ncbi:MAG TPA: S8 family peptidase [Lachnospiraceae bacterium]|nr:S8 family peptidase [Lachnospiraceae bacterium]